MDSSNAHGSRNPSQVMLAPYLLVAGVFLTTLFIVPPHGEFPLNDDWMYAKIVQHLVETGAYQASPYADPTFILQAYWGAAFAKIFGLSFETLRLSTLVLALVAGWATVWAAREAGAGRTASGIAGVMLVINPLFLNTAYTFMTDVPFIALLTLGMAAYLRWLRTGAVRWMLIGSIAAAAALLVRQFAVLLPVIFSGVVFVAAIKKQRTPTWRDGLAFAAPWLAVLVLLRMLPVGGEGVPQNWNWDALGHGVVERLLSVGRHAAISLAYLGLFMAPVIAPRAARVLRHAREGKRAAGILAVLSCVLAALMLGGWENRLPKLGNLLYDLGVGPILLPGMLEGYEIAAPLRLGAGWWIITVVAIVCGAWILIESVKRVGSVLRKDAGAGDIAALFVVGVGAALVMVLVLPPIQARFDRYLLMALPALAVIVVSGKTGDGGEKRVGMVVGGTFALWLFAIIALQDYLAWNAARWQATERLINHEGVQVHRINGGYEFNGWYHSDAFIEESRATGHKIFGPKGWWIRDDDYAVSMRPLKHFETIGSIPYYTWLGFAQREILIQRRTEPDPLF